jgi:hypothetical protein
MREQILIFVSTGNGLLVTCSSIGIVVLILLCLWLTSRDRAKHFKRDVQSAEQRAGSFAKERDAALARTATLEEKYSGILAIDREIANRTGSIANLELQIAELRTSYASKRMVFDRLNNEIAVFEDRIELAELGMFRPVISLGSTEEYKRAIEGVRDRQKAMISAKTAVVCTTTWTVHGSEAQGRTMVNRNVRLTLRAYNNECEVLINRVSWKNFDSIKSRMAKCRQTYNDLNTSLSVEITEAYELLKFEELRLVYEEALKHQEEKDQIREEKEREREEAKAQRELQAEIARSEKRERQREEALAAARSELAAASEIERTAYQARVAELEEQLKSAHEQTERTKSMAEQTRIGHVYIISNIGAFGEEVFKIGMTRRLEPRDRIRELGDASVPFPFEVHALIFTEDAPTLERELHEAMADARVNRVNLRKEFFRAPGQRVAQVVRERFPSVIYVENPQSQEYLGSIPVQNLNVAIQSEIESRLPVEI